jgi:hypothetical protein
MVYVLYKFIHYLLGSHFKMYTDHSKLRYLVKKLVLWGRICRWLLLFQEYHFEVIMKARNFNSGPDHLSHILSGEYEGNLDENLSNAHLLVIKMVDDYFVETIEFFSIGVAPPDFTVEQNKKLVVKVVDYQLIVGNLYKLVT